MNAKRIFTLSALTSFISGGIGAGVGAAIFSGIHEVLLTSLVSSTSASALFWFIVAKPGTPEVVMHRELPQRESVES